MNPGEYDHPDLTAHVLGELDAEHTEAMAQWIEAHPEAQAEAGHIADFAQMLSESAPVSFHTLLPHQRAAVLSGPQRVRQMVAAAKQAPPRSSRAVAIITGLGRLAAAAVMLIVGYITGSHFTKPSPTSIAVAQPAASGAEKPKTQAPKTEPFRAREVPQPVVVDVPNVDPPKPEPAAVPPAPGPKDVPVVAMVSKVELPPAPRQPKIVLAQPTNQVSSQAFVSTSKTGLTQVSLRPADTRPVRHKQDKGLLNAAPMTATAKETVAHSGKVPELLIHSWKAEVASCPWDEGHRLVRLVVQIPGEQLAASSPANSYPLQMNFSPNTVRSFRKLGERTVPAQEMDSPAFHIVWFEVVPNGQVPDGSTRTLGDITLPNARFTTPTQAMAPFDSTKLRVLDHGATWQAAQEDFLFESAVVGFGLLLQGEKETGHLNHALVLDLAQRSKQDDRTGEHAKFVNTLLDAQRAAGLK